MQDNHRNLMDAFVRCLVVDEGFANEIAEIADRCDQDGNYVVAAAMRNVSRNHRIRTMEGHARIAVLARQDADII